jgi:hypothetical protein
VIVSGDAVGGFAGGGGVVVTVGVNVLVAVRPAASVMMYVIAKPAAGRVPLLTYVTTPVVGLRV